MNRLWLQFLRAASVLAVVAVVCQMAAGQRDGNRRPGGGMGGRGFGVVSVRLASLEPVQQVLKLTNEQQQRVAEINDQLQADRRELFERGSGDFRQLRSDMEKLYKEATAELREVLDEQQQQQRLAGISIQVNDGAALVDPLVAAVLQLTDEQKSKVFETGESIRQEMRDEFRKWRDANLSRDEFRSKFAEQRSEASSKLTAVLTSEQQEQFEALRGEPVEIELTELGRESSRDSQRRGRAAGERVNEPEAPAQK
jgi:Spy/CpxP family protein refolding chaperone